MQRIKARTNATTIRNLPDGSVMTVTHYGHYGRFMAMRTNEFGEVLFRLTREHFGGHKTLLCTEEVAIEWE